MYIKELTINEFYECAKKSDLFSYMQTKEYARLMAERGYNYDYIGLVKDDKVIAASLILWKRILYNIKFGYAPKGFLVNYYDMELLETFTKLIIKYYKHKNFAFIKVNPEIVIGGINTRDYSFVSNPNASLVTKLVALGYKKLKNNLYFEAQTPRFEAYIDLKRTKFENYTKATRNKVNNSKRKGLKLEKFDIDNISDISSILLKKDLNAYRTFHSIFSENDSIDFYVVKADFEQLIKNSEKLYEEELDKNYLYNEIIHRSNKKSAINTKMNSDAKITIFKNEIKFATNLLKDNKDVIVAYAIVVRQDNRAVLIESNFDRSFPFNQNYFLFDALINKYKENKFEYLSIGPVSGDFKKDSPYYTLNRFKIGFNPSIYEFIGEFDLVINKYMYNYLLRSGRLAKEFNKKSIDEVNR